MVLRILILPDDLVVLADLQLRIQAAVQLNDLRDLEPQVLLAVIVVVLSVRASLGINGQAALCIDPFKRILIRLGDVPGNGLG